MRASELDAAAVGACQAGIYVCWRPYHSFDLGTRSRERLTFELISSLSPSTLPGADSAVADGFRERCSAATTARCCSTRACGETARKSPTGPHSYLSTVQERLDIVHIQFADCTFACGNPNSVFPNYEQIETAFMKRLSVLPKRHGPANQLRRVIAVQQLVVATSFASCSRMTRPLSLHHAALPLELSIIQSASQQQQLR